MINCKIGGQKGKLEKYICICYFTTYARERLGKVAAGSRSRGADRHRWVEGVNNLCLR